MRRMYSKKQLEKLISELSGDLIEVTNIKQLSDEECDGLKVGDIVAKKTGKQYHCYIVTFKQDKGGLCLSYFDASCIETQSYDYTEGHWVYNSEDKTDFSNIGGLPEVTALDNEKVLEVIAGAWAKGRKKVNLMDAPSSTTLTDEQCENIRNGVFINGEFLNFKSPILCPLQDNVRRGIIIGATTDWRSQIRGYEISDNVISISSDMPIISLSQNKISITPSGNYDYGDIELKGKKLPNYSSNSVVSQFICRKGTLEWYVPVAQNNITSGDVIALNSDLGKALLDHLEVEINGFRARYEYTSGNYVVYSSKTEADSGLKLQVNMISYNTTNGELSFNQMTFTPDA